MATIRHLVEEIRRRADCVVYPTGPSYRLRDVDRMPTDLAEFYSLCGGVHLHAGAPLSFRIVEPQDFVRANPEIAGCEQPDDITDTWYVVARCDLDVISIDCSEARLGRCYDSFWDRHGVPGSCTVVALSFGQLLERLLRASGAGLFWVDDPAMSHGDAYDQ